MRVTRPIETVGGRHRLESGMGFIPSGRFPFKERPDGIDRGSSMPKRDVQHFWDLQVVIKAKSLTSSSDDERLSP